MHRFLGIFLLFLAAPVWGEKGAEKFSITGNVLTYDTETNIDKDHDAVEVADVDVLRALLKANPNITQITLNSSGGGYYAGFDMADLIIDYGLNTHVAGECISSCAFIFLGGAKRTMEKGSKLGFHNNSWAASSIEEFYNNKKTRYNWSTPFDLSSWLYQDTQEEVFTELEYFLERGVDARFAIQSIRDRGDDIWYPRRRELTRAGVLRELDKVGDCDGIVDCLLPKRKQ